MTLHAPGLYMLDTDTCSYVIKGGHPRLDARLRATAPHDVSISVLTRAELLYGLERLAPTSRLHLLVREFLSMIQTIPWDAEAADWYAKIRHQLDAKGKTIGTMDMMIAAHSLSARATLVTNNVRHYERIQDTPFAFVNWMA